jgi:hypothetical protein
MLAFLAQAHKTKTEAKTKLRGDLIKSYHQNIVNMTTLMTYKNTFFPEFNFKFNNLNYGFDDLEYFFGIYVDADENIISELQIRWRQLFRHIFQKTMTSERIACVYKQYWEKPEFISFDHSELSQIVRSSPDILGVVTCFHSTVKLIEQQLVKRDALAETLEIFAGDHEAVTLPTEAFAKSIFKLLRCRSSLLETVDRAIALSFALSALLENHYFREFGKINFRHVIFTKENLSLLPPLEQYNNFYGGDMSGYIVKSRHDRAWNIANGHRELNLPTAIMPKRL